VKRLRLSERFRAQISRNRKILDLADAARPQDAQKRIDSGKNRVLVKQAFISIRVCFPSREHKRALYCITSCDLVCRPLPSRRWRRRGRGRGRGRGGSHLAAQKSLLLYCLTGKNVGISKSAHIGVLNRSNETRQYCLPILKAGWLIKFRNPLCVFDLGTICDRPRWRFSFT